MMGIRFRVLACPIDASTGDRRRFAEGAITHQDLPMPLGWVRADSMGHDGAVTVGFIDAVDMQKSGPWLEGEIFTEGDEGITPSILEDAASALFLAKKGVVGPSVDLDDFDAVPVKVGSDEPLELDDFMDDEDMEMELLVTKGRMRSATLVRIPAFVETNHSMTFEEVEEVVEGDDGPIAKEPVDVEEEDYALVASVSGSTDLSVVDEREHPWDGPAAAGRVFDAFSDEDGNVDRESASRAFLWVDGDGTKRGDYKLGFADIVDGDLKIIPRGVAATAGGRGVDSADGVDREAVKSRICSLYAKVRATFEDWPECPFDSGEASAQAITASVAPTYSVDVFTPPVPITGPTRITFDFEHGMAYGHIFQHGVCHVGISDECRMPPTDEDFRYFHVHPVETEDGTVYAGRITAGGKHPSASLSLSATQRAYDTKETVAWVRARVDEFGILVCGPLSQDITPETKDTILARRKVSGHWPEAGTQGDIFLAEVLALAPGDPRDSEPGFPVAFSFRRGRLVGMTASLGPDGGAPITSVAATPEAIAQRAAQIMREDAAARAALCATVEAEEVAAADAMRAALMRAMGE
jgi:hypothetical protein